MFGFIFSLFHRPRWIGTHSPYAFFLGNDQQYHIANVGQGSKPPCGEVIYHDRPVLRIETDFFCMECARAGYPIFDTTAEEN